ncbi:MAG: hypothetical protein ACRCWR_08520 [Saezia sp.]
MKPPMGVLPYNLAIILARVERYGFLIVIGLLVAGVLDRFWISPLMDVGLTLITWVVFKPLGVM